MALLLQKKGTFTPGTPNRGERGQGGRRGPINSKHKHWNFERNSYVLLVIMVRQQSLLAFQYGQFTSGKNLQA